MMTATRIYSVFDSEVGVTHLVRAATKSQAVNHVVRARFEANVATQSELVALIAEGVAVEDATAEPKAPAPEPVAEPAPLPDFIVQPEAAPCAVTSE